ncbi:unnamed protein product [Mytilus coruscus]|uniref:LRAT domain-containing protein n=1 Tax=Mytilus coruscus TaxID=42192 RepID=A0A6J8BFX1_MYTCO|nr:unnamed protein product [Mytilus coruscus]
MLECYVVNNQDFSIFKNYKLFCHGEDDTIRIEFKEENSEILGQEKDPNIKLQNYDDFRRKCKPLSHIKVKREGGYFHHFLVLVISKVSDGIDAVTIGQCTSSADIEIENCNGHCKFAQQTFLMEQIDKHTHTHAILNFKQGVFLVKQDNYPSTREEIELASYRLSDIIGERMYDISSNNCEHAISYILTRKSVGAQEENDLNELKNYDDFRRQCKPLSHIKVKREGGYFHHFVVLAISSVSNWIDAVTIGQCTSSAKIGMENCNGDCKFVQQTFLMEEFDKHIHKHAILNFEQGVFLVKQENYPSTRKEIEEAFNRLSEKIGERKYDISSNNCEHEIIYILTGLNKLENYDDFRRKCKSKPLSHIQVKRAGGYFHHFVVLAISNVSDPRADTRDAVTIGHYTSSAEIGMESCDGIGKFIQQTIFVGENKKHDILDFNQGVYLVEKENYPSKEDKFEEAFNRLNDRIGERKYELLSNNCEHAINYIFTGKSFSHQADTKTFSKKCFNDLFKILIIDCKEVGLKTALLVAALGAIAGSLVRRAYVRVIVAAIVSLTVESSIIKCGNKRGSNLRNEADIRIDLAAHLPYINDALKNTSSAILDDMKNHTDTNFVCNIAEKLIYEAALTTCLATVAVSSGIETILFLSFVFNNLIPRRRKNTLQERDLCRLLFLQLFAGYGSIGIAVVKEQFVGDNKTPFLSDCLSLLI